MKNRVVSLLLALCVVFPLLTITAGDAAKRDVLLQERRESVQRLLRSHLDQAVLESTPDAQMKNLCGMFWKAARSKNAGTSLPAEAVLKACHERIVAPLLPPHDILLYDQLGASAPVFLSGRLGEFPAAAGDFPVLALASSSSNSEPAVASASVRIRAALQVVFPSVIQRDWYGKWQVLRDREKTRALYWSVIENRYLLVFYINIDSIGSDFVPRLLAATWPFRTSGVAFIPDGDAPIVASSYLSRRPGLMRRIDAARSVLLRPRFRFAGQGAFAIAAAPVTPGLSGRFVGVTPLRTLPEHDGIGGPAKKAVLYLLLALCLFGLFRPSSGTHEREFSVRFLLMTTFLAVAVLPLAGVDYLTGRFLVEYFRNQKREVADTLHRELLAIDENGRHNLASYTSYLKSLNSIRSFASALPAAESQSLAPFELFKRALAVMDRSESLFFHMFLAIPRTGPHLHLLIEFGGLIENPKKDFLISRFIQRSPSRFRRYDGAAGASGEADGADDATSPAMAGLEKEMASEIILRLVGPDTFISLLLYPERVFEMSVLFNSAFSLETVIRGPEAPSPTGSRASRVGYLVYWFWNSSLLERKYLNDCLKQLESPARPHDLYAGLAGLQTTARFYPFRMNKAPASFPALQEALTDVHASRGSIRKEDQVGGERLLVEALPAKYLKAELAGQKSISHLDRERSGLELRISLLMLGLFGIAMITGALGGLYFILPLQRIISGIGEIRNGMFQTRLDETRNDEFGSLATAFNRLAKGLEEGQLLRRYVSDSAKKAAKTSRDEFADGRNGAVITATILFSSLHEFSEFQARSDARTVFETLEQHLEIANEAISENGGEIDKIIGDKIMIVFRHDECGGDADAARCAFSVIAHMRRIAAERGLYPGLCIGINTGPVVSGIVGSEETHLDYTVIGDPVNLAARLAAMAQRLPGCRTVVSGTTRAIVGDTIAMERLGTTRVKGKSQEIETWLL